ncbi:MAG: MATE family efflux transporter [Firmicutes bacterium]|nr:MATE family efflux transporter [Bacillota bacterium]
MHKIFGDKAFLKNLALLSIPIILNDIINSLINVMDTFMTGKLGAESVTAVGLGNQVFFLFTLITFGIASGASVFMGQYWGKNDIQNIKKILGIGYVLVFIDALLFFLVAELIPQTVMSIYSKDPKVVEIGANYLKIVGFSYFLTAFTVINNAALKSTGNTFQPMLTTLVSLISNIIFNCIFIFGMKMGVQGAAWGTLLARSCEILLQLVLIYTRKIPIFGKFTEYFAFNRPFLKTYFKIALPVILNETMWAVGTSIYNIAYKYSGTVAQASLQVAGVVQNLFMVFGTGVGTACGILIANALGSSDRQRAKDTAFKCTLISLLLSLFFGVVLAVSAPYIIGLFDIGSLGANYARIMLYIISAGMLFKIVNFIFIVGILRNGGDTLFCLFADACSVWFVGVPMAFLGSAVLHLPIYITFALVYLEEVVKTAFTLPRILSGKWLKNIVGERNEKRHHR